MTKPDSQEFRDDVVMVACRGQAPRKQSDNEEGRRPGVTDGTQRVLDDFHSGAAEVLGVKGNEIVVRVPGVTGTNVNPGAGFPSQPTNVFFIKGSSSPSVVPYNPGWTP